METRVTKWGNSLAVRIPRALAEEMGLYDHAAVTLSLREGQLLIAPVAATLHLETLVAQITPENRHGEVDIGPSVGREAW